MNVGTQDVGQSISAAGTTQATATLLFNGLNQVTTVASGSGVVLFGGTGGATNQGTVQMVYNGGANALKVYPPLGVGINGLAANSAHLLAPNTGCAYWTVNSTLIMGLLSA